MPPGPILWSWSVDETVLFSALSRLIKTLSVASSFWKIKDFRIALRGMISCADVLVVKLGIDFKLA